MPRMISPRATWKLLRAGDLHGRLRATRDGLVEGDGDGPWRLTRQGRTAVKDDLVRASCEAFAGFHTASTATSGASSPAALRRPPARPRRPAAAAAGRATVLETDVRTAAEERGGALAEPFDLALLANVVYYVPRAGTTCHGPDGRRCSARSPGCSPPTGGWWW